MVISRGWVTPASVSTAICRAAPGATSGHRMLTSVGEAYNTGTYCWFTCTRVPPKAIELPERSDRMESACLNHLPRSQATAKGLQEAGSVWDRTGSPDPTSMVVCPVALL